MLIQTQYALGAREIQNRHKLSDGDIRDYTNDAQSDEFQLMLFSAMRELNTDPPFALAGFDFQGISENAKLSVHQSRMSSLIPGVDPSRIGLSVFLSNTGSSHALNTPIESRRTTAPY